jgi:hypothetical protein
MIAQVFVATRRFAEATGVDGRTWHLRHGVTLPKTVR